MTTVPDFAMFAQEFRPDRLVAYRSVGGVTLHLHLFLPTTPAGRSAVLWFHGGGWTGGTPTQFYPQCRALAGRGMLAASAEYRLAASHGITPFDGLADAKAAVRWLRQHAADLDFDPACLTVGGGSAGGHLAAATALLDLEEPDADTPVSCVPAALLLCNPVLDTTESGYGAAFIGPRCRELSPVHHVRPGAPPAVVFHGTADTTVPLANAQRFALAMRQAGNRCDLHAYPGHTHGFFNYGRNETYADVLTHSLAFLRSLSLVQGACAEEGS